IAINKFDKKGSLDALRDVKKQYRRNNNLWDTPDDQLPIFGTIASQFNDTGTNLLYVKLMEKLVEKTGVTALSPTNFTNIVGKQNIENYNPETATSAYVIPPSRVRYLAEIAENSEKYDKFVSTQTEIARKMYQLNGVIEQLRADIGKTRINVISPLTPEGGTDEIASKAPFGGLGASVVRAIQYIQGEPEYLKELIERYNALEKQLDADCKQQLQDWEKTVKLYKADKYQFQVRDKIIEQDLYTISLANNKIPKISLPKYKDWGDILKWIMTENTPGFFPYAAGVFPLKREGEDPARMFAGEGGPERTNKRFHFVSQGLPAKRLSTAFDSVTLYGENPDYR
ncbi:MAG: methylmalonyl-CoA mutase, partial [Thermoflexibacteraceae bacterium]